LFFHNYLHAVGAFGPAALTEKRKLQGCSVTGEIDAVEK